MRHYRQLRTQVPEKRAIELTLARWQPTQPEDFPLCASSIRQWHRIAEREGFEGLRIKAKRPQTIHYQVPAVLVDHFTLRYLFGWGGHRIAAELQGRAIGQVSGQTVYKIFDRLTAHQGLRSQRALGRHCLPTVRKEAPQRPVAH